MSFINWECSYLPGEEFASLWTICKDTRHICKPLLSQPVHFFHKEKEWSLEGMTNWQPITVHTLARPLPHTVMAILLTVSKHDWASLNLTQRTNNKSSKHAICTRGLPKKVWAKGRKPMNDHRGTYRGISVPISPLLNSCYCLLHLYKVWKQNTGNI